MVKVLCRVAWTIPVSIIVLFGLNRFGGVDFSGRSGAFLASSTSLLPSAGVFYRLALGTGLGLTYKCLFHYLEETLQLRSLFCNSAKMDGHRPFRKYLSIVDLTRAFTGSYANKIDCKYSRCTVHCNSDSCWYWEIHLNRLRMLLAKVRSFPRFFWRKSLNSSYIIRSFIFLEQCFVSAIAGLLPCRKTRQQKRLDLGHWPRRFQNGPYIVGKNDSNLDVSSYNTSCKTKSLRVICRVQSLLGAGHVSSSWQIILRPT